MTNNGITPLPVGGGQGTEPTAAEARHKKLQKAAQDFEAVFIGNMLKQMRKPITGENTLLGNSSEAKMYQEMMDEATAKQMSRTGSFGLANLLCRTLEPNQPAAAAAAEPNQPAATHPSRGKELPSTLPKG